MTGRGRTAEAVNYLVTGGAGFIGSHFVRHLLANEPGCRVVNLDKLTYAGNLENLEQVSGDTRYRFIQGDIADPAAAAAAMEGAEVAVNFAAETHVDRSIMSAEDFIRTDVLGVHTLLEAGRKAGLKLFLQISTDEVYGSIDRGSFREGDPLSPNSPYSASKAGGDLLALAYGRTHGLPVIVTRSSNNYGPNQYPEKMIPLFITNLLEGEPVPLYGDGLNVRDWLHVADNCEGILTAIRRGTPGEAYNIGAGREMTNLALTRDLLTLMGAGADRIRRVTDRPAHDRRYSVDCAKLRALGWAPRRDFRDGLRETVAWYREHPAWWRRIKSGEYREYYRRQYRDLGA
jgi:dTDP-glucose 4,6-dehydratase